MNIHVITDGKRTVEELVSHILLFHNEVDFIHIREKEKPVSALMRIVTLLLKNGVSKEKLVINDRLDVCLVNELSTIHLPGTSFSAKEVKDFAPLLRVGCSIHSLSEALNAERADYLLFGHVFESNSKLNLTPRGIQELEKICQSVHIPVVAIGGITPETVSRLPLDQLGGIAVMSYVMSSDNPKRAIQLLKKRMI